MEGNTQGAGKTIICMAMVFINGLMVGGSKECMSKIKNMAMVSTFGRMDVNMMGSGKTVNNMDLVITDTRISPMQ